MSENEKDAILLRALPGAFAERFAGVRVVRFRNHLILKKQVTHLGFPWPEFKKRIQIPGSWLHVYEEAQQAGLEVRFIGIYAYGSVIVFVDFDPATYVLRKANNSAAHVATNDLYQAQVHGEFSRVDRNENRLTSVRSDLFASYLLRGYSRLDPHLEIISRFNNQFLTGHTLGALEAVREMHEAAWPDRFQGEWPGFYLEYRLDRFLRSARLEHLIKYTKAKQFGAFDYDLVFGDGGEIDYFGDLKASDYVKRESPGNDAATMRRCIDQYGRFWYLIYEHSTRHSRDHGDVATVQWNEWKRSVGYVNGKEYNPLSYARRFKESVRFFRMKILEVNEANFATVLGDFTQGQQQGGAPRALKVMIKKTNIDNFLIFSRDIDSSAT